MATLAELKDQLRALKAEIDKIQALYDQFGNIEDTPVGRVWAVKLKFNGSSDFSIDLFIKVSTNGWKSTAFSGQKTQSELLTLLTNSSIQWFNKVGAVDMTL